MTEEEIKTEISDIVKTLKAAEKRQLAQCIEENWDKTAITYSKELNSWKPSKPMEKELLSAFEKELTRLETPTDLKLKILDSLEKRRILQTGPHLVATEGPRMLCVNWLGSLGIKSEDFYVVGMFSGIPFSNNFHPGRIKKKNDSINLFPSSLQDGLVYRSIIQNKLVESINTLPAQIKKSAPSVEIGESYTKWALGLCQNIEREILKKDNLIYLDINEVISQYLIEVFKNKNHILYKIFFDSKTREEFIKIFPNETIFYYPHMDGKYEKMESMTFYKTGLKGKNKEISLTDPKILTEELRNGRICPALILIFMTVTFLNQFKCFGSFYQVEYLPDYQKKFADLKIMYGLDIDKIPTANLTTGVFPTNPDLCPIDIIMGEKLELNPNILFGELLLPIKDKLINGRNHHK